ELSRIFTSRLRRLEAGIADLECDFDACQDRILAVLSALGAEGGVTSSSYLVREGIRRTLDFAVRLALKLGRLDRALSSARLCVSCDPYCGRAWLILGEVANRADQRGLAAEAYERAALLGPLERPYALEQLASI